MGLGVGDGGWGLVVGAELWGFEVRGLCVVFVRCVRAMTSLWARAFRPPCLSG